ncbi:OsmC family protein [Fluviispira sanaruensis]|uniref:OsmC family peroxiredoxin n=1 Tax=Fluviispira sanaruensis TaxID=2493639 RepID=A0A4P2VT69_FLUSA|nr:OsmC family protein [Fluviispira sanaruensis]BBH52545.1 OsmC family peroxiredoxin [Fluviispira sanaruensis]
MGVKITGKLIGVNSTEITHGPSGAIIKTTAPVDNGGDGSLFSPTDLCAASLGACATTVISMFAHKNNINLSSIEFHIEKEMSSSPRRISNLIVTFLIKTNCSDEDFKRLVGAGKTCPVRKSLSEHMNFEEKYERI